jgi:hypothetical protein
MSFKLPRIGMLRQLLLTMPAAMVFVVGLGQAPLQAQAAIPTPAYGQWYDDGPGCASTRPARAKGKLMLRL